MYLVSVEKVLPDRVGGHSDGGERVEVALRQPDGDGRVLLSQALPERDALAEDSLAEPLAEDKLNDAGY